MSKRLTFTLIAAAKADGIVGARLRLAHSGPRLVGRTKGRKVSVQFPTAGDKLTNIALINALMRALGNRKGR